MSEWISYNDLAWTEPVLAKPGEWEDEVLAFCDIIKKHAKTDVKSLLHLACGAGIYDYTLKKHFEITGVDVSPGMLDIARKVNPEVSYYYGDMRSVNLEEKFDAVIIPDAIGYMTTLDDLRKVVANAAAHLKSGGIFLATVHTREEFRENNFAYSGSDGETEITVFENNYITDKEKTGYEATIIYLIRSGGKLEIHSDVHRLGLFTLETWTALLAEFAFEVNQERLNHLYDPFILGEGEYPLTVFACLKK